MMRTHPTIHTTSDILHKSERLLRVLGYKAWPGERAISFPRGPLESPTHQPSPTFVQRSLDLMSAIRGKVKSTTIGRYITAIKATPRGVFNFQLFLVVLTYALGGCPKGRRWHSAREK